MNTTKMLLLAAREWESKKNYNWSARNYDSALFSLLKDSVNNYNDQISGTHFLLENESSEILERVLNSYVCLVEEIRAEKWPPAVIGGNFHFCVFSHMSWLLRQFEEAQQFVQYATDPRFESTRFLSEYARALAALTRKTSYQPPSFELKGLERYWWHYLVLISDLTNNRDPADSVNSVKSSFKSKNQDQRLADNYDIEGTGKHPVKWDFRLASILEYASEFYGFPKLSHDT